MSYSSDTHRGDLWGHFAKLPKLRVASFDNMSLGAMLMICASTSLIVIIKFCKFQIAANFWPKQRH